MTKCSVFVRPAGPDDIVIVRVSEFELRYFLKKSREFTKLRTWQPEPACSRNIFYVETFAPRKTIASFYLEEGEDLPEYLTE